MHFHSYRYTFKICCASILCHSCYQSPVLVPVDAFESAPVAQRRSIIPLVVRTKAGATNLSRSMTRRCPLLKKSTEGEDDWQQIQMPKVNDAKSNFWISVEDKVPSDDDSKLKSAPWLDSDGPLPPFAYQIIRGNDSDNEDRVPTCLLTVAIDLTSCCDGMPGKEDEQPKKNMQNRNNNTIKKRKKIATAWEEIVEPKNIVADMQQYIDSGLTTFSLKSSSSTDTSIGTRNDQQQQEWGEQYVYGKLQTTTPNSVLDHVHLLKQLDTPTSFQGVRRIRESVASSLQRMNVDHMDTIQLQYCNFEDNIPFLFDALEILEDLRQEGLIRSICTRNVPPKYLVQANGYGFRSDSNQIDANVMDTIEYSSRPLIKTCTDLDMNLLLSSPLAGGLLASQFIEDQAHDRRPPMPWDLTRTLQNHMKTTLPKWYNTQQQQPQHQQQGSARSHNAWNAYRRMVVEPISEIATKHGVSISSVALRWAMQLDYTSSVVTSCTLGRRVENGLKNQNRSRALRQAFKFELDEDDMERLWSISGGRPPKEGLNDPFDLEDLTEDDMERFLIR